jgi:hypothetical protein
VLARLWQLIPGMTTPGTARPRRGRTIAKAIALVWMASVASACRPDEVTHFRVKKAPEASFAGTARPAGPMPEQVPPPAVPARASGLRWTLPKGWTEVPGSGMRYATLKPPNPGRIDVSVVVLAGPAGGELANVNRWRGQLGLPPLDEVGLSAARKTIQARIGKVLVYDFSSEGQNRTRTVAGLAVGDGSTWFVKMTGDAGPVGAARSEFNHLLRSLHLDRAD